MTRTGGEPPPSLRPLAEKSKRHESLETQPTAAVRRTCECLDTQWRSTLRTLIVAAVERTDSLRRRSLARPGVRPPGWLGPKPGPKPGPNPEAEEHDARLMPLMAGLRSRGLLEAEVAMAKAAAAVDVLLLRIAGRRVSEEREAEAEGGSPASPASPHTPAAPTWDPARGPAARQLGRPTYTRHAPKGRNGCLPPRRSDGRVLLDRSWGQGALRSAAAGGERPAAVCSAICEGGAPIGTRSLISHSSSIQ